MFPSNRRRIMNTAGLDGSPRNLGKMDYGPSYKLKKKVVQSTDPNSMGVMEKTLERTKAKGYKGANWIK